MSDIPKCGHGWHGSDGKDHYCGEYEGHTGKCVCDCGERGWAANPSPLKVKLKPFYKRRKESQ